MKTGLGRGRTRWGALGAWAVLLACGEPARPPCLTHALALSPHPIHDGVTFVRVEARGEVGARVTLSRVAPAEELAQRHASPPPPTVVPPATLTEVHAVRHTGLLDALVGLATGAVAGLSNMVLAPVTVPLNMLVGSDPFPVPWARPTGTLVPSVELDQFLADVVLPPDAHAAALAALQQDVQREAADAKAAEAPGCVVDSAGACEVAGLALAGLRVDVVGTDDGCQETRLAVEVEGTRPDLDRGALATGQAWKAPFPSGQRLVGPLARVAFESSEAALGTLEGTPLACLVRVTGKGKRLLQARVSLGFLEATGITVRATEPGNTLAVLLPGVTARAGAHLRVAVVDVAPDHPPWGAALAVPLASLPLKHVEGPLTLECKSWHPSVEEHEAMARRAQRALDAAAAPLGKAETAFSTKALLRRAGRAATLWAAADDVLAVGAGDGAAEAAANAQKAWRGQVAAAFALEKEGRMELGGVKVTRATLRCGQTCEVVLALGREPPGMLVPSDVRALSDDGEPVRVTLVEVNKRTAKLTLDAQKLRGAALFSTRDGSGPLLARP